MDEYVAVGPTLGQNEVATVEPDGIMLGNAVLHPSLHGCGGSVVEGIESIVIGRFIVFTGHLPAHGYTDVVPRGVVKVGSFEVSLSRAFRSARHEAELPGAVEINEISVLRVFPRSVETAVGHERCFIGIWHECGMATLFINLSDSLVGDPRLIEGIGSVGSACHGCQNYGECAFFHLHISSISLSSSLVKGVASSARRLSASCCVLLAPPSTDVTALSRSTHERAICARV